jgi:spoIIIJ-associated protein
MTEENKVDEPSLVGKLEEEGDIAADYLEGLLDITDLDGDIDIDAIQELTRLAVQTSTGDRSRLMLDIDGYRAGRKEELRKIAKESAEEVISTKSSLKLAPMNAFERKIIHDTIQDLGLTSESEGEDPNRSVVIFPN